MINMFGGSPSSPPPLGDPYLFHPSLYTCKYSTQYGHDIIVDVIPTIVTTFISKPYTTLLRYPC